MYTNNFKYKLGSLLLRIPIVNRKRVSIYKLMGAKISSTARLSKFTLIGDCRMLNIFSHAEINSDCFIVAKAPITIGENSTLAYQVSLFTSAYPNGPHNKLSELYDKVREPIKIGKDCWIGARVTILPGVTIGDYVVIAAGSIVTHDIQSGVLVAGAPAVVKKKLKEPE